MLIDSHCHIPHKKYKKSAAEIIAEAQKEGVGKLITIGTSVRENELAIKTAENFKNVFCTIGIYPHENLDETVEDLKSALEKQLNMFDKIIGIGECGIDISNWQGGRSLEEQLKLFEMQIEVAKNNDLPIMIHNRNGDEHILNLFENIDISQLRGVFHCFSSSWEFAEKVLDLGFYISFSGTITYPSAKNLLETVKNVPLDRFLIETDAPYLPPQKHRGEINYPKHVKIIAEKVAQVKQKPPEEIAGYAYNNTHRLFTKLK